MKTFYITTLGCKVNQYDSQEIRQRLLDFGLEESNKNEKADICIVNTCCVTHNADRKSRHAIRDVVRKNSGSLVAVTGCYAGYDRRALEEMGGVDRIFEHGKKGRLFEWIREESKGERKTNSLGKSFGSRTRAYLKIQDGCNNHCSYCIVPLMRGSSRSKDFSLVLDEAHRLIEAGHKEIVLTGVNLGAFGKDSTKKIDLVDVICGLEEIKGLARIRLSSIEAADVTQGLIEKMASSGKLCPHLHIPFQSGDDQVLKDMNKKLLVSGYKTIVEKARKYIRDLSITCDFIVGYPTEDEKKFKNTLDFIKFVKPLRTHIFSYSPRRGVTAQKQGTQTLKEEIKSRFARLKTLSEALSVEFKSGFIGKELDVLFETKTNGLWHGYSQNYVKVAVLSKIPLRNILTRVKIISPKDDYMLATMQ